MQYTACWQIVIYSFINFICNSRKGNNILSHLYSVLFQLLYDVFMEIDDYDFFLLNRK